jgi:hypothetical protein
MRALEGGDDFRQQVGAGNARSDYAERAGPRLAQFGDPALALRQDGFGAQDVVGEEPAGSGQHAAALAALNQQHAELALDLGDVLRHRGLTDAQLRCGAGKGASARKGRERTQAGVELHNCML